MCVGGGKWGEEALGAILGFSYVVDNQDVSYGEKAKAKWVKSTLCLGLKIWCFRSKDKQVFKKPAYVFGESSGGSAAKTKAL